MHVPGVEGRLEQRALGSPRHDNVFPPCGVQGSEGVRDDCVDRRVSAHTGHGAQIEGAVQSSQQQGAGVVDAGVDVEHDRQGHGEILPEQLARPRRSAVSSRWHALVRFER
jgi:hypothetical protein